MKVFLVLILAVVGMHHVLSDGDDAASVELPAWFEPESMTAASKADLRVQLEGALEEMEAFIANPPTRT